MLKMALFFLFIHLSLLVPSFGYILKSHAFNKKISFQLISSYVLTIVALALVATISYVTKLNMHMLQVIVWGWFALGTYFFVQQRAYKKLWSVRFILICFLAISLLSSVFITLNFTGKYTYIPDPEVLSARNYDVANVKVLNISKTQANDNYVPYRQAQFIVNRSDLGNDCFICEWGVGFFQRTPLMGAVTAGYYIMLNEKPPVDYLWSKNAVDQHNTYLQFQLIANVLNTLFILPAFFVLIKLFDKKTALLSSLILILSPFFLYNSFFSWPKSLVAFFVLFMWLLLFENRLRYTVLAACVGGLAYVTHDLAIFYIAASVLFLLINKRYKHAVIFSAISSVLALPWILLSSVVYKKPSTFALYPFSLHGLPQPGHQKEIIHEFLHTSPVEIISIRFDTLFYLLTPYDLIYKTANQDIWRRVWATGIFSVPGSLGFGLVIPVIIGIFKKLQKLDYWVLVLAPILCSAAIVGWRGSRAIASLHFSQAIIVLLTGLAIACMLSFKHKIWLYFILVVQVLQLLFMMLYSYDFHASTWLNSIGDILGVTIIFGIIVVTCFMFVNVVNSKKLPKWSSIN